MSDKEKQKKENADKNFLIQNPKGMKDTLPAEQVWWEKLKKEVKESADFYNFGRIDTPVLEYAQIFEKAEGEATDIVEKEMYTLRTKGGDRLALRPELTPVMMRTYFQHGMSRQSQPVKLYYFGPMFRHENPQSGRYRQFHQIGFEILGGEDDPIYDAQIILINQRLLEELKLKNLSVSINSIGCRACRANYRKKLQDYYRNKQNKICDDCKRRLEVNPLRLLDCKEEKCREFKAQAPTIMNYLCSLCRGHFRTVLEYVDELALPYAVNPFLVRGLDYYSRTVFEFFAETPDQNQSKMNGIALGGGGRYDYLAESMGLRKGPFPAIGSSLGVERVIEAMKAQNIGVPVLPKPRVFLIQIGKEAKKKALNLIEEFRRADLRISEAFGKESLSTQLKLADKEGVDFSLVFGQREVFENSIIIRDMKSGGQETVPLQKAVDEVKKRLR